jgi:sodium/potassium-transporting ATPase subunit alpha
MKVDNSSLTGESILLIRTIECTSPENPLETKNLAFFGTLCKEGNGKGVVINTADRTVIGQIANLATSAQNDMTTLRKELNRFILIIAAIAISTGIIFLILGFATGSDPITVIVCSMAIIVANAPEGLMATFTVALSITARRLS